MAVEYAFPGSYEVTDAIFPQIQQSSLVQAQKLVHILNKNHSQPNLPRAKAPLSVERATELTNEMKQTVALRAAKRHVAQSLER